MAGARFRDLDVARGAGMLLVVVGHMPDFPEVKFWIYLFHMPLFFVVSGILFRPREAWPYAVDRTRSLMLPYLVFFLVVLVLDNLLSRVSGVPPSLNWTDPRLFVPRLFFGGSSLFGAYAAFWFVGCLWISLISLNFVCSFWNLASWKVGGVILVLLAVTTVERPDLKSPQGLADVPIAIVFLWSGAMVAVVGYRRVALVVACIAVSAACLAFVAEFDMKKVEFGNLLNPVIAVSLSLCWLAGSYLLDRVPLVGAATAAIGRASLTIMFLHALVLLHGRSVIGNRYLLAGLALLIPVAIHYLIERNDTACQYLLGKKSTPRPKLAPLSE